MEENRKYRYGTEENRNFLKEQAESLLRFGKNFPSPGGSAYWLGDDGTPWKDRDRETWITARMAHVYSLGTMLGHDWCRPLAEDAIRGLSGELHDDTNGGWYAAVSPDGTGKGPKQCYAHAFVILAASSGRLAEIPGAESLLDLAEQTYDRYFWEEDKGLAVDTWNTEFTELDPYRGLNANMHSTEAFLAAADAEGKSCYRVRAGKIIDHVIAWARENDWRIPEHYTSRWEPDLDCNADRKDDPFKPYGATPGHGIEWARLITQWALSAYGQSEDNPDRAHPGTARTGASKSEAAQPEAAKPYLDAAEHLYRRAVQDGWNADGAPGIVYTTDWDGHPVVHDRMHWTIAEAINTSSVLYRVTGKEEYGRDYASFMQYLDEKVIDHGNGSWFHQLDRTNQVIGTVWPGKSDLYHAVQAMLIPYEDTGLSIASALVKKV